MGKLAFGLKLIQKYIAGQDEDCPHCGSADTVLLQRKRGLLQLRRCNSCALLFRYPKDDSNENRSYYQKKYRQAEVTDLPPEEEIPNHVATSFTKVGRDVSLHLRTIRDFAPHGRLLDYGCSWGYCVYQFREAGYEAAGFEISQPRVEYGRSMLGLDLTSDVASLPDASFDVIYSAHVLEHIPNPALSFRNFQRLLKPGGQLILYVPNGAGEDARQLGAEWGPMVNEKHVLALTAEFFHRNLPAYGFSLKFASSPFTEAPRSYEDQPFLEGGELLVIGERTRD